MTRGFGFLEPLFGGRSNEQRTGTTEAELEALRVRLESEVAELSSLTDDALAGRMERLKQLEVTFETLQAHIGETLVKIAATTLFGGAVSLGAALAEHSHSDHAPSVLAGGLALTALINTVLIGRETLAQLKQRAQIRLIAKNT